MISSIASPAALLFLLLLLFFFLFLVILTLPLLGLFRGIGHELAAIVDACPLRFPIIDIEYSSSIEHMTAVTDHCQ